MSDDNKEIENVEDAIEVVLEDDNGNESADGSDQNGGTEQKSGSSAGDSGRSEEKGSSAEDSDDELTDYSEGVKKRISKLTGKMREAERREKAALEYAQSVQKQLDEQAKRANAYENNSFVETKGRIDAQEHLLRNALRYAIENGDVEKQMEAQQAIAQHTMDKNRLAAWEQQRKQQAEQPAQQVQQPAAQQPAPARPDPKAEAWADRNAWFGKDQPMTLTAFSIHKTLVEQEGFDPTTDDYYRELDRRVRGEFPHKFQQAERKPNVVAPAVRSNTPGQPAGGKVQIKLTPSQVAIAKKLGVSLEQYARQVAALRKNS